MKKLIINIDDSVTDLESLEVVHIVIGKGKVSKARGIKHYCWITKFHNGTTVSVRDKKTEKSADSFCVYKTNN